MSALAADMCIAGRYRLQHELGRGGMGVVWAAHQEDLGRDVALKILGASLEHDPRARARFEREARVASALDHPGAVRVFELGECEGRLFLAMERVWGAPLRARLEVGTRVTHPSRGGAAPLATMPATPLSLDESLEIAWQIADVLWAAHRADIVHRDLKPENIMLETADAKVRLVDFGLAFLSGGTGTSRMTAEGVVAGTPAYTSPEQARGGAVDGATDVYALGCVLFEMISGRPPFLGADAEVLTRHMYAPPPPLRSQGAPLPASLEALVARLLDKRADARPTALEAREQLADATGQEGRGRSREDAHVLGRAARMVPAPPEGAPEAAAPGEVALYGGVHPDLFLALGAAGLTPYVVGEGEEVGQPAAVFLASDATERLGSLVALAPVVCEANASDVSALRALIRAGASDVVPSPAQASEVVRRLLRAIRRNGGAH